MIKIGMQKDTDVLKRRFSFKMPDTYVLIASIIILAALLTYIIPAGKFDMVKGAAGQMVVDAKTFHYIPSTPVGFMGLLLAIPEGLMAASKIILVLFIVGGVFKIIRETNALDLSVYAAVQRFGNSVLLLIPIIVLLTGFLGTAGVFISSCLPFIPLGLVIAKQMKLDAIFAVAIIFLGSHVGFMASPICPLTTIVAQQIAGLPLYSGLAFRITVTICLLLIATYYGKINAQVIVQDTIPVNPGWNMLASLGNGAASEILYSVPTGIIVSSFFRFNPGGGYEAADTLSKGYGYWVKVSGSGLIIFLKHALVVPCPGTATVQYGGKIYNTVQIGYQCWLKENLDMVQGLTQA